MVRNYPNYPDDERTFIGSDLKFCWVKKEIDGIPNPHNAYFLLIGCRLCGQKNKTIISIDKDFVLNNGSSRSFFKGGNLLKEYLKNIEIKDCVCRCINCGHTIIYNSDDCFL